MRKREGDGATPIGRWTVRAFFVRPDGRLRLRSRALPAPARVIAKQDGWCDAPGDRNYNRPVRHPYPASAERLWRADDLYDVIVVLGYNDQPRRRGAGSAIFLHLMRRRDNGEPAPTEGCVALAARDLAIVIAKLRPGSAVRVLG
jgi:L,D-peptidoglycan transpeptidase YkuD (ErfK/YbiS/YcfS/YnhG family)